ncbi:MAG: IS30 family transposase [Psychromonas sp.]|nr:IS30 family transposase [Psychromonas sp.]
MKKHKQLTEPLRYQLYALNKSRINQTQIAEQLGVDQSLISRELKRNIGNRGYRVKQANNKAIQTRKKAVSCPVMTLDPIECITSTLKEKWSPDQITGRLKSAIETTIKVSHETNYKFIWEDKKQGCDLYKFLSGNLKNIIQDLVKASWTRVHNGSYRHRRSSNCF